MNTMTKAIIFERAEAKGNVEDRQATIRIAWRIVHPAGTNLSIVVSADGIDSVGGMPAFDNQKEETAWKWQVDMAIIALRFIKQGSLVPPDEQLMALAASTKEPE